MTIVTYTATWVPDDDPCRAPTPAWRPASQDAVVAVVQLTGAALAEAVTAVLWIRR